MAWSARSTRRRDGERGVDPSSHRRKRSPACHASRHDCASPRTRPVAAAQSSFQGTRAVGGERGVVPSRSTVSCSTASRACPVCVSPPTRSALVSHRLPRRLTATRGLRSSRSIAESSRSPSFPEARTRGRPRRVPRAASARRSIRTETSSRQHALPVVAGLGAVLFTSTRARSRRLRVPHPDSARRSAITDTWSRALRQPAPRTRGRHPRRSIRQTSPGSHARQPASASRSIQRVT